MDKIRDFLNHWLARLGIGGGLGLAAALAVNLFVIGDPLKHFPFFANVLFWGLNVAGAVVGMYIAGKYFTKKTP